MKIWIINQYASLPTTGVGGRHRHLARELAACGHDVTVVASRWDHLTRDEAAADAAPQIQQFEGFRYVNIDVPKYNGAHDKKRFIAWAVFAWRILGLRKLLGEKPDVVLYSSVSMFAYLSAKHIARKARARLIFEVRDIWPLTLTQVGGISPRHPMIRLLQWIEDHAYRTADHVVSNLPGAFDHMQTRGLPPERFTWIANGMSLAEVENIEPPLPVLDQIPQDKFVIGYTGSIGAVNFLSSALEVARELGEESGIVFVIVGKGPGRAALEAEVRKHDLRNVLIMDPVPKSQVQNVLARVDVCLQSWPDSPLYDFGVAANKLFDYFYSGKPVLHCYSGRYDPVSAYEAGVLIPAEDVQALKKAVVELRDTPEDIRRQMGENGRRAVLEHHEYGHLARQLEQVMSPSQGRLDPTSVSGGT